MSCEFRVGFDRVKGELEVRPVNWGGGLRQFWEARDGVHSRPRYCVVLPRSSPYEGCLAGGLSVSHMSRNM